MQGRRGELGRTNAEPSLGAGETEPAKVPDGLQYPTGSR